MDHILMNGFADSCGPESTSEAVGMIQTTFGAELWSGTGNKEATKVAHDVR